MTKTPLTQYLSATGDSQAALASAVGVTQGAISKMVLAKRTVFVITNKSGKPIKLLEERIVSSSKAA